MPEGAFYAFADVSALYAGKRVAGSGGFCERLLARRMSPRCPATPSATTPACASRSRRPARSGSRKACGAPRRAAPGTPAVEGCDVTGGRPVSARSPSRRERSEPQAPTRTAERTASDRDLQERLEQDRDRRRPREAGSPRQAEQTEHGDAPEDEPEEPRGRARAASSAPERRRATPVGRARRRSSGCSGGPRGRNRRGSDKRGEEQDGRDQTTTRRACGPRRPGGAVLEDLVAQPAQAPPRDRRRARRRRERRAAGT